MYGHMILYMYGDISVYAYCNQLLRLSWLHFFRSCLCLRIPYAKIEGKNSYENSEISKSEDELEFTLYRDNLAENDINENEYGDTESDSDDSDIRSSSKMKDTN